jgi:hypothetical protein
MKSFQPQRALRYTKENLLAFGFPSCTLVSFVVQGFGFYP